MVKILIDDEKPADATEYEVTRTDSEKDEETKIHSIMLKDFGMKPIKLASGSKLHIMLRIT